MEDPRILISDTFPELPEPNIIRENFLNLMDRSFSNNYDLILVEGEEGFGKTTTLAQFAMRHSLECFAFFAKPTGRWTYDPEIIKTDLCNQIHTYICGNPLPVDLLVDDTLLKKYFSQLKNKAIRFRKAFYFTIDGLEEIADNDQNAFKAILNLIPFGYQGFKFVLSGPESLYLSILTKYHQNYRICSLPPFIMGEVQQYLSNLDLSQSDYAYIYQITSGIPGHCASLKRALMNGKWLHDIPKDLPELIEYEWNLSPPSDDIDTMFLSIIALDQKKHTVEFMANVLCVDYGAIYKLIDKFKYIKFDNSQKEIVFVSEMFRRFVAEKLLCNKQKVANAIIQYMICNNEKEDYLLEIPQYMNMAENYAEMLDLLTTENIKHMIEISKSWQIVKQNILLGFETSYKSNRNGEAIKYGLQYGAIEDIISSSIDKLKVEALLSTNNISDAINMAHNAIAKEDQFTFLVVIAKHFKDKGVQLDEYIIDEINSLYNEINISALGNRAIDIASDLVSVNTELAIDLIEKSKRTSEKEDALDLRYARLSLMAMATDESSESHAVAAEKLQSKIRDEKLRKVLESVQLFFGTYDSAAIIKETSKYEKTKDQFFVLTQWLKKNSTLPQALDVSEYALDKCIKSIDVIPNPRLFRELSIPIVKSAEKDRVLGIISLLDAQKTHLQKVGPSEEYVRLQLLIISAEIENSIESYIDRIMETYFYILEIKDISIKASCLARLLSFITKSTQCKHINETLEINDDIIRQYKESIDLLLTSTADHLYAVSNIIGTLSTRNTDMAIALAKSLNTYYRRQYAMVEIVKHICRQNLVDIDGHAIETVLGEINEIGMKEEVIYNVIKKVCDSKPDKDTCEKWFSQYLPLIDTMQDVELQSLSYAYVYVLLFTMENGDEIKIKRIISDMNRTWRAIDVNWLKVATGYRIIKIISQCSLSIATEFLSLMKEHQSDSDIDRDSYAITMVQCLRLAIKALSGLISKGLELNEDIDRIESVINRIPSSGEKARLWSDLALTFAKNEKTKELINTVTNKVEPLYSSIESTDRIYKHDVLSYIAPSLYLAHNVPALEKIEALPYPFSELAISNICDFIFTKTLSFEPFDSSRETDYKLNEYEAYDLCKLISLAKDDWFIYSSIEKVVVSLLSPKNSFHFTKTVKSDICLRLKNIIDSIFPNTLNISHEGYKIVSEIQLLRIEDGGKASWDSLIKRARAIQNTADRAFVLAEIARFAPSKHVKLQDIVEEVHAIAISIPSVLDRIGRLSMLSRNIHEKDIGYAKRIMKEAMKESQQGEGKDIDEWRREVIDYADKLDKEYAQELLSVFDNDDARAYMKGEYEKRKRIANMKQILIEKKKKKAEKDNKENSKDNVDECWRAAQSAVGMLNAERILPKRLRDMREICLTASQLPLSKSYYIFYWIVENIIRQRYIDDEEKRALRVIFISALEVAEMTSVINCKERKKEMDNAKWDATSDSTIWIKPGEREKAITIISEWLKNNISEYLIIVDPYFSPECMDIIKLIREIDEDCPISIITNMKKQRKYMKDCSLKQCYLRTWLKCISESDPGDVMFTVMGTDQDESPLHDRKMITKGAGIKIGTSFNSLGISSDSEITFMTTSDLESARHQYQSYLAHTIVKHNGEKLRYTTFGLNDIGD